MQVDVAERRFILNYLWFDVCAGRTYLWLKKPLNAGRAVFDCRSLQVGIGSSAILANAYATVHYQISDGDFGLAFVLLFHRQATIAVTLISICMVGKPNASTPTCVHMGA